MRKSNLFKTILFCFLVFPAMWVHAQGLQKIKGRITDSTGAPIPGANIQLKGKNRITTAAQDGGFTMTVPADGILVISAVGFAPTQVAVEGKTEVNVSLGINNRALDEVVVTALGVKREKRNLTFSSQEIKSEELTRAQEPNVLNAMTGKVAGVQITSSTGAPGSSSSIVIRGTTSLTGDNQALVVIDGVPMNNDETDYGGLGGPGNNRLADLDPGIIESINVLKGAAATALYGSAGARGVLLITTKAGRNNKKPTVTLSSGVSFDNAIFAPRQNTYAQGSNGVYVDGVTAKTSTSWGPRIDTLYENGVKVPYINQMKEFFQTGVTNNNTISVAGGGATSNYFVSYSYFDQTGTVPDTKLNRHNLFTKFTNQLAPNLVLTSELTYVNSKNFLINQGYGLQNPMLTVYIAPISYNMKPYLNPDGTQRLYRYSRDNPYWLLDNSGNTSLVNRFLPVVNLTYTPTSWLSLTERVGADIYVDQFNSYLNIGDVSYANGWLRSNNENFRQYNHDLMAQLKGRYGKFDLSLLLGNNVWSKYSGYMTATGTGLTKSGWYNMANASSVTYSETNYLQRKVGYYAQGEVDYDRLLILSLSGRYDGSSVLSTQNTWYPYGSAALAFIFSELFDGNLKRVVNFAKARISYASVGNDNVTPYATATPYLQVNSTNIYNTNISFPYGGQNGFLVDPSEGNPNLKNELQREFEAGLETKLLDNRIGLEASYFDRHMTNGLVQGVTLASSSGYGSTTVNSAKIETKGVEVLLNVTPVRTRDFSWDVTVNYTKLNTKVQQIVPGTNLFNIGFTYAAAGKPYGMLYGTTYARDTKGNLLLDDNGLPYSDGSESFLGTVTPDWTGGITNTFRYKQFGLSFFFDTRQGGVLQNVDEYYNLFYGVSKATENRQDRVIPGISASTGKANTVSTTAQAYFQTISYITESQIQKASYIKLRNVSLNYSLSPSLLKGSPFKEAMITFTGRNLWIHKDAGFTGSDPESNNTYGTANGSLGVYTFGVPTSRSIGCSLKLVF
jgi:TonB-linked SusC/RagA family outer membrane protein